MNGHNKSSRENYLLFTTLENRARNLEHHANTQGARDMFM